MRGRNWDGDGTGEEAEAEAVKSCRAHSFLTLSYTCIAYSMTAPDMFSHGRQDGGKRTRRHRRHRARPHHQRGGLFDGVGSTLRELIVPAALFIAQKQQQRRTTTHKTRRVRRHHSRKH
jgi:hypothetical protein